MNIKRLFVLLMVLVLAITCVACGGGSDTTTTAAPDATTTAAATTTKAPVTTTAPATTTKAPETTTAAPATTTEAAAVEINLDPFKVALSIKNPGTIAPAASYTVWDGSVASSFAAGTGTKEDPYLISNGAELAYLAKLVNEIPLVPDPEAADGSMKVDTNPTVGMYYKLTADIYLNDISNIEAWLDDPFTVPEGINLWTPIGVAARNVPESINIGDGEKTRQFAGHFDGAGFTVFGAYTAPEIYYAGVFGYAVGVRTSDDQPAVETAADVLVDGFTWDMMYTTISNLNVSHSVFTGYGYMSPVCAYYKNAGFYNCTVDDTVTVIHIGNEQGTSDAGPTGMTARGHGWIEKCVTAADVWAIPVLVEVTNEETGEVTPKWFFAKYSAGITVAHSGMIKECATFGNVDACYRYGMIIAYAGQSSNGTAIRDCYAGGTMTNCYDRINKDDLAKTEITNLWQVGGLFAARTAHVDTTLACNVERCVSDVKVADNFFENLGGTFGYVANATHNWNGVDNMIWVNYDFDMTAYQITTDWELKSSFIWTNIYEVTPDQIAEFRAQFGN